MESKADLPRSRLKRRLLWPVAGLGLVALAGLAALPLFLNASAGRRWLLERANRAIAPGRLDVARFRFTWTGPTRIEGLILKAPDGKTVASFPSVDWDRNLAQILAQAPRLGTFRAAMPRLDVERRGDGSIDLVEALRPIFNRTPKSDWTLQIVDGDLTIRDPSLVEPVRTDAFQLTLRRPAAPGKLAWDATLGEQGVRSLQIRGDLDRWDGRAEGRNGLAINVRAETWPIAIQQAGTTARSTLSGSLDATRADGLWDHVGRVDLDHLQLSGTTLPIDRFALDRAALRWSLRQTPAGWSVESAHLDSPIAEIVANGTIPPRPGEPIKITGHLDLPELARRWSATSSPMPDLILDRGRGELTITGVADGDRRVWDAEVRLSDLAGHSGATSATFRDGATLAVRVKEEDRSLVVDGFSLATSFLKARGSGDLDAGVEVAGELDLAAMRRQLGEWINLGALAIDGSGRLRGNLRRDRSTLSARLEADFDTAHLGPGDDALAMEGLTLGGSASGPSSALANWRWDARLGLRGAARAGLAIGPAELRVRGGEGPIAIDPIATTLNGGSLRIVPGYIAEPSPAIVLRAGTELTDADVNEEATRRVLAFVAPILDGATRVTGRVSAKIDRAVIPLRRDSAKTTVVEGDVVFRDLLFTPGPLADAVLGLLNRDRSLMRLDQPVVLAISDGVVHTRGLAVPIGDLAAVEIEGDVGFDRTLDLRASLPITPAMFPNGGVVGQIVSGSRVTVPIRGTLDQPKVDRDAFRAQMAATGKDLLQRGAARGVAELLLRLAQPRDPNAPPPPSAEERRQQRLDRKAERRAKRAGT